jgi:hypothetical protein
MRVGGGTIQEGIHAHMPAVRSCSTLNRLSLRIVLSTILPHPITVHRMTVVSASQNSATNFNLSKSNICEASAAYALERPLLVEMLWSMSSTSMKPSRASSVPNGNVSHQRKTEAIGHVRSIPTMPSTTSNLLVNSFSSGQVVLGHGEGGRVFLEASVHEIQPSFPSYREGGQARY